MYYLRYIISCPPCRKSWNRSQWGRGPCGGNGRTERACHDMRVSKAKQVKCSQAQILTVEGFPFYDIFLEKECEWRLLVYMRKRQSYYLDFHWFSCVSPPIQHTDCEWRLSLVTRAIYRQFSGGGRTYCFKLPTLFWVGNNTKLAIFKTVHEEWCKKSQKVEFGVFLCYRGWLQGNESGWLESQSQETDLPFTLYQKEKWLQKK